MLLVWHNHTLRVTDLVAHDFWHTDAEALLKPAGSNLGRVTGFKSSDVPQFESLSYLWQAAWPWTHYSISLSFSFLISKIGIKYYLPDDRIVKIKRDDSVKFLAQCTVHGQYLMKSTYIYYSEKWNQIVWSCTKGGYNRQNQLGSTAVTNIPPPPDLRALRHQGLFLAHATCPLGIGEEGLLVSVMQGSRLREQQPS